MRTLLNPIDGRKSFYGKAAMFEKDGIYQLQSYDTIVARYDKNANRLQIFGWYSATTAKHINSFLVYHGFNTLSKKEMQNYVMPVTN